MKHTSTTFPDLPRGERMRSFYRAVKRRETWATKIWAMRDRPIQYCLALLYRNVDIKAIIYRSNPLLDLIKQDKEWEGKYFPIPGDKK